MWRCATAKNRKFSMLNLRLCVEEYRHTYTHIFNVTAPTAISYKKFLIFRLIIFSESLLCAVLLLQRKREHKKYFFSFFFWDRKHSWNIFVRRSLFFAILEVLFCNFCLNFIHLQILRGN